ncbi:MAG: prepilin-type N-terminal cleavage/methylation domain-containing protein [Planctomycetota bacterium]
MVLRPASGRSIDRGRSAFSLIELLVVLAIVALLLGILLPALSASRAAAADTQCKANLRQVTVAQLTYHQDYGVFSRLWSGSDGDGEAVNNPVSPLAGYLQVDRQELPKPGSVMQCPSVDPGEFDRLAPLVPPGQQVSSYGINPAMQFDRWSFDPEVTGAVFRASELILVGEQPIEPFEQLQTADGITAEPLAYGGARWIQLVDHDPYRGYRHAPNGANFAMHDGSARRLFHEALDLTGKHWAWWDTNFDPKTMSTYGSGELGGCGCN